MNINTKFFGEVQVNENELIHFEDGLPGFKDYKEFLIISDKKDALNNKDNKDNKDNNKNPFSWLQSVDDVDIVFTLFDTSEFIPDYAPAINNEFLVSLGSTNVEELVICCIANIPSDTKQMSVNLKAPIVINTTNNKAKQIVCDNENYPLKYYVYKELKK